MTVGEIEHKTSIGCKIIDQFENYINAIDVDYDSKTLFSHNGCIN